MLRCTFYGAVRTVTGSMHFVETAGVRVLLDCGLFQGPRAQSYDVNSHFPFPPSSIDAVVLSHAHLDHCGNLPTLVRQGFRGPIYCTGATRDLAGLVLRDSAKVQHQDATHLNKLRTAQGLRQVAPLYTAEEAEQAIGRLVATGYERPFSVGGARVSFYGAGHILGAAITVVEADGRVLGFTGDLGRPGAPLLDDPSTPPAVDVLLMESTYGDRDHDPFDVAEVRLGEAVRQTLVRGGKVLIPAFAVERTQDITYTLHRLRDAGGVADVSMFVDSPMAVDATEIYRRHPESLATTIRSRLEHDDPFGFRKLRYVRSVEESKALNEMTEPFVVIATSGMCESGRILHHLLHHIGDPHSSLLLVSFQAAETLGRRLADGVSPVNILGESHEVRLQVQVLPAWSAHAGRSELLAWVRKVPKVGRVYCVHGEEGPSLALAHQLAATGYAADVPARGQTIEV
jgi:metallo-beta-lactamase family protein